MGRRARLHGDRAVTRPTLAERFWLRVDKRGPDECWPWAGNINRLGYGTVSRGASRSDRAHRVSYELNVGPIPEGMHVLHSCDNRRCVNPAHLRTGTHAENMRDLVERKRLPDRRGERANNSKLTEDQVRAIRVRRAAGERQIALAREYGVDKTLIWMIVTRKIWTHV